MSNSKKVDSVNVRMYRHGFGDCFLLSFIAEDETRVFTMLIDCGIKYQTKRKEVPMDDVIKNLKEELTPGGAEKPQLDILIVTHEHWDHLSSFYPTEKHDYFKDFQIGQVWLAWTENPDDQEARAINSRLRKGALALSIAAEKLAKVENEETDRLKFLYGGSSISAGRADFNLQMNEVLGFYGISLKEESESGIWYDPNGEVSTKSEKALKNVLNFRNAGTEIKYFSPGTTVEKDLLPSGINIFVLGPPRSSLINKSNPSHGHEQETYFGIDHGGLTGFVDGLLGANGVDPTFPDSNCPFKQAMGMSVDRAQHEDFFRDHYYNLDGGYRRIENSWLNVAGQFALQLDGAVNNTSLVLAIELAKTGKVLLFPGDAQVGSWLSWHDYEWEVEGSKQRNAKDLLRNTVLYKVSHHGSHNATLRDKGLEMMKHDDLVAMIPEQNDSYKGILYKPLMEELKKRCKGRVLVSADVNYPPEALKRPDGLSQTAWDQFKANLKVETMYIEYTIRG